VKEKSLQSWRYKTLAVIKRHKNHLSLHGFKLCLLQTIDLYEARDLAQVQVTLYKLGSAAQKNGFPGPVIGVKVAEKNVRNFDERRKKDGMNVIGLQVL